MALVAASIYLFLIRPIAEKESRLKPVMLNAANELMKCSLESQIIEGCYTKYTSKAFQGAMNLNQFTAMMNKVREKLGNRLSSEIINDKFNLMVFKGNPSGERIDMVLKSAYQNDIFAHETYIYSLDQTTNEYKLDSIRFASDKLIN